MGRIRAVGSVLRTRPGMPRISWHVLTTGSSTKDPHHDPLEYVEWPGVSWSTTFQDTRLVFAVTCQCSKNGILLKIQLLMVQSSAVVLPIICWGKVVIFERFFLICSNPLSKRKYCLSLKRTRKSRSPALKMIDSFDTYRVGSVNF